MEPDTVRISWNQPCEEGNWLLDTQAGCRMWDWHPEATDKAHWTGSCRAGGPRTVGAWCSGSSTACRSTASRAPIEPASARGWAATSGTIRDSFEGSYANDVPQGRGTLRIDDVVLSGEWSKGCLATAGKVVAIGVPRSSCGPVGKPTPKVADESRRTAEWPGGLPVQQDA